MNKYWIYTLINRRSCVRLGDALPVFIHLNKGVNLGRYYCLFVQTCGPVIEYSLAVVIVVHFKRRLECLNFCVYTESSVFYIFMLYMLIHTELAVEIVVVLWNRVYNLRIHVLYVWKGEDGGKEWGCAHITRFKPPVVNYYHWPFGLSSSPLFFYVLHVLLMSWCMIDGMRVFVH